MKFENVSNNVKPFKVDGLWVNVRPGGFIELDVQAHLAEEGIKLIEGSKRFIEKKPEVVVEEKVYTKTDLMDMKKVDQVRILKGLGKSFIAIKFLRTEKSRVEKILELQDDKE